MVQRSKKFSVPSPAATIAKGRLDFHWGCQVKEHTLVAQIPVRFTGLPMAPNLYFQPVGLPVRMQSGISGCMQGYCISAGGTNRAVLLALL